MGKEFAERRVATGETASQAGTLPDLRPLRSAPASGVASGRDHESERRESLSDQASGSGAVKTGDQSVEGKVRISWVNRAPELISGLRRHPVGLSGGSRFYIPTV